MRIWVVVLMFLAISFGAAAEWTFPTLQGEEIPIERFYEGKWCFAFIVAPECTACAVTVGWLKNWQEEQTSSQISVALVVPWDTPELRASLEGVPFPVVVDSRFVLASWFKVKVAPTVALFAEGTFDEKLEWPFSEGDLRAGLAELEGFVIPRPQDLLGEALPEFQGEDLQGEGVSSDRIPTPSLLFFFSTTCPACRASLEMLPSLTAEVPVVLLVLTKGHELTPEDREELEVLQERYGKKLTVAILGDREQETMERFRIRWTPTFFFVDENGILKAVWEGPQETLPLEVEELLGAGRE